MTPEHTTPYAKRAWQLLIVGAVLMGTAYCWFLVDPSATVTVVTCIAAFAGLSLSIAGMFEWRRHEKQLWLQVSEQADSSYKST